ncbi:hypothetical protein [Lentilitoribacter sp. EG35]|uniref:hypothetical protein n=1 Tax=Lentilitoribacter sp. EG35 TaxID=3234192 RepID=UPI00346058A1
MTKKRNTQTKPFSMRLTFEERANLESRAGKKSLAEFVRSKLFNKDEIENRKEKYKGRTECAKILGLLGRSEIAKNLNELSRAAKSGSLIVSPDTQVMLDQSIADIHIMRNALLNELGVQSGRKQ